MRFWVFYVDAASRGDGVREAILFFIETQWSNSTRRGRSRVGSFRGVGRAFVEEEVVGAGVTGSTALEISNRRREMLRLERLGVEPKEFIPSVASKFGVKVDAVRRDWSNREKWMKVYFRVEDARSLVLEHLLEHDVAQEETLLLISQEKNPKAKVQLIYLYLKILDRKTEIMKQVGAFEMLKCDYESKAREYARKLLEDVFPWMKGNWDRLNTALAVAKSKGQYKTVEMLALEKLCAESFEPNE